MFIKDEIIKFGEHELLLRNATSADAEILLQYLRTTSEETPFLIREPEETEITLSEECKFIENYNLSKCDLLILAFLDGKYIGNCSFAGSSLSRQRHRATMGIALYKKFTGMGIGKIMIERLCDIAKENGIEQMELEVVTSNERAIKLYKKLEFQIFGTLPLNMKYKDGTYADVYWMMKKL